MCRYSKIKVNFSPGNGKIPYFTGSILRGVLGYSLKNMSCINPQKKCDNCFAQASCLYFGLIHKKNHAKKYRFEFDLGQGSYDFSLYLFSDSVEQLPYILSAIHKMATEYGFGRQRYKPHIDLIAVNGVSVFSNKTFNLQNVKPEFLSSIKLPDYSSGRLVFKTPFRIKQKGVLLKNKAPFDLILKSILQRKTKLFKDPNFKGYPSLQHEPSFKIKDAHLQFKDLVRYSGRQKSKMKFGGIVGYINFEEIDKKSLKILKQGEILGVGKQTTFGLGQIKLEMRGSNEV